MNTYQRGGPCEFVSDSIIQLYVYQELEQDHKCVWSLFLPWSPRVIPAIKNGITRHIISSEDLGYLENVCVESDQAISTILRMIRINKMKFPTECCPIARQ